MTDFDKITYRVLVILLLRNTVLDYGVGKCVVVLLDMVHEVLGCKCVVVLLGLIHELVV